MKEFKIDGVIIFSALEDLTKDEAGRYLDYVNEHGTFNREEFKVAEINIVPCDDGKIDVNYTLKTKKKFERIRRITGSDCRP